MTAIPHECVLEHMPPELNKYESEIGILLTDEANRKDYDECMSLLDRYNRLTDKENDPNVDPFELYGIDDEKTEIIDRLIVIESKYLEKAKELYEHYKQIEDEEQ